MIRGSPGYTGRPLNPICPRCSVTKKHPNRGYCLKCEHDRQVERYSDPVKHEAHKRRVREHMRELRASRKVAA